MRYALLIYSQPGSMEAMSPEVYETVHAEYMAINQVPGIVGGDQLAGVETATTVRVSDGETLITDGPFADTKEIFGGFYLLEAADIDAALAVAAKIPAARLGGSVEVRPIIEQPS